MRSATATPPVEPLLPLRLVVERVPFPLVARGNIPIELLRSPPYGNQAFTQLEKTVTPRAAAVSRIDRVCNERERGGGGNNEPGRLEQVAVSAVGVGEGESWRSVKK